MGAVTVPAQLAAPRPPSANIFESGGKGVLVGSGSACVRLPNGDTNPTGLARGGSVARRT